MSAVLLSQSELDLVHRIRTQADELCRMVQEANNAAITVNFNLNPLIGACDRFDVYKMVPIDLRQGAN